MFPSARPFHRERSRYHSVVETARFGNLLRPIRIEHEYEVKIAVTYVTDECRGYRRILEIAFGLADALGETRDRHANIRCPTPRSRPQGQRRIISVMPRLPELGAFLGCCRPAEIIAAVVAGNRLYHGRLLGNPCRRAVEFEEKGWRYFVIELRIPVDSGDLSFVEQLYASDRYAALDRENDRIDSVLDCRERANRSRNSLGNAVKLDGQLGNDAQRAF